MINCNKYTISIFYRAKSGSEREKMLIEASKAYNCDPDTHLIDRILADRLKLFEYHKAEIARIAQEELRLAEAKRALYGG